MKGYLYNPHATAGAADVAMQDKKKTVWCDCAMGVQVPQVRRKIVNPEEGRKKRKEKQQKVGKQRKIRERETPTRENRTPVYPHVPWTEAKSWHQPESSRPSAKKSCSSTGALPTATIAAKHIGNIRPIRTGASDLYYLAVIFATGNCPASPKA